MRSPQAKIAIITVILVAVTLGVLILAMMQQAEVSCEGMVVARIGKGEIFGEVGFLTDSTRSATVVARGACMVRVVTREAFIPTVQKSLQELPVQEVEPYLHRWHVELIEAGIDVDTKCKDWTRHYRLPNVIREGQTYVSPFVDLGRMQTITLDPLPPMPPMLAPTKKGAAPKEESTKPK